MDAQEFGFKSAWAVALALWFSALGFAADSPDDALKLVNAGNTPQQVLAYRFTPGMFADYEGEQTQQVRTKFAGGNESVRNVTKTRRNIRVVSVGADGSAVIEPTVKSVKMWAKFNETQPIEYDSEQKEPPLPQFQKIAATVGRPLTRMVFTVNGQLTKVTPLQGAPEDVAQAASKLDATMNSLVVFPTAPVGVGAIWREKFTTTVNASGGKIAVPVTMQREYQLTKVEGNRATIGLVTKTLTPLSDNPQAQAQLLSRQLAGTIEFDTALGLIVSQHLQASGVVVEAFGPKTAMDSAIVTKEKLIPSGQGVQPATLKELGAVP